MTEFTASIRDLTRKRAQKTGKSYQLGIRMLGDIGQMRSIGLDVAGWVKNDLIDFVSPSNFFQGSWDMPFGNLRQEFGDDVAIFGVTEGIANWLNVYSPELKRERARPLPASIELLRGNAGGKLAMGVDGIECFNFFTADEPASREEDALGVGYDALAELADLEALRGKPKQYVLATQLGAVRLLYAETCEQLPAYLAAEYRGAFQVAMCAEIQLEGLELVIQIVVEAADRFFALGVSFNGTPPNFSSRLTAELLFPVGSYTSHSDGHMAFNFSFSVSQIRDGMNDIVVYNGSSNLDEDPVRILSVELGVKFATV